MINTKCNSGNINNNNDLELQGNESLLRNDYQESSKWQLSQPYNLKKHSIFVFLFTVTNSGTGKLCFFNISKFSIFFPTIYSPTIFFQQSKIKLQLKASNFPVYMCIILPFLPIQIFLDS